MSTALAVAFYGQKPRYAYYDGCSQGGHEPLTEVQRYPTDFNGALAAAPAAIMTELNGIHRAWNYAANADAKGNAILLAAKVSILHKAAPHCLTGKVTQGELLPDMKRGRTHAPRAVGWRDTV